MKDFVTKLDLRIDWSELDAFRHVNNLAIMKYVQAARVNYLEMVGLMQMQAEQKMGPILVSINCQFRKPLFYPGNVTIYSKITEVKHTSFLMQHLICDESGETAAEAQDVIVFYDFQNDTKLAIPDAIRAKIESLQKSGLAKANE